MMAAALLSAPGAGQGTQQGPRDRQIRKEAHDADTLAWWHRTEQLASDSMNGREPGTPEFDRAAAMVAAEWKAAGLEPAGEAGTYFQPVPLHKLDLAPDGTRFELLRAGADPVELRSLQQIAVRLTATTPASFRAPLRWEGYCEPAQLAGQLLAGTIAVCFRPHLSAARLRSSGTSTVTDALHAANVAGVLLVDDPSEPLEPPRWPLPTARVVTLRDAAPAAAKAPALLTLRLNWEALPALLAGTPHTAAELLDAARTHAPSPSFPLATTLAAQLHITVRDFSANNVLAVLPGTAKPDEYLAVSAHLDGYGLV